MKIAVIGSGLSGLTAAALLAKEGHNVVVYEQHEKIGGVTASIEKDGYRWDWGQMLIPDLSKGEPGRLILEQLGISDQVKTIKSFREYSFPDFTISRPVKYQGIYWRKNFLRELFPEDAEGLERYYRIYDRIHDIIGLTRKSGFLSKLKVFTKFLPLIKKKNWTTQQLMDYCFSNQKLQSVFTHILADYTSNTNIFPGLIIPLINAENQFDERIPLQYGNHQPRSSWVFIIGGMITLVNALSKAVVDNGGKILTETAITKIKIERDRVKSIITSDGKESEIDAVVASGGAKELFLNLIGKQHFSEEFIKTYINDLFLTQSVFMVHLGVDYDPSIHQNGAALRYYYRSYNLNEVLDKLEKGIYHEGQDGFLIYIPSKHSPEMAPPDHHAVTIYTIAPNKLTEGDWERDKESFAEKLLDYVEEYVPDLGIHEKTRIILTPKDFQKRTHLQHHAFGGTVPHLTIAPPAHKTPIHGLWFIGAQSENFGGVTAAMTGAENTVKMMLSEMDSKKTKQSFKKFSKGGT
jgi:phytoene dehydrogenase-like protein